MRLVVLHAAVVYVPARVVATMALKGALGGAAGVQAPIETGPAGVTGGWIAVLVVALTVVIAAIDRRRVGAPLLLANLGFSRGELLVGSALPAIIVEGLLTLLVSA